MRDASSSPGTGRRRLTHCGPAMLAAAAACLPPVEAFGTYRPNSGWRKDEDLMKWLCSL